MADLFQRDRSVIFRHVKNVFDDGELRPEATIAKFAIVASEGDREVARDVDHYNLDVIISVGYRVKSHRGTQFRIWATQRLREYLVKGFTMDDERLWPARHTVLPADGAVTACPDPDAAWTEVASALRRIVKEIADILAAPPVGLFPRI